MLNGGGALLVLAKDGLLLLLGEGGEHGRGGRPVREVSPLSPYKGVESEPGSPLVVWMTLVDVVEAVLGVPPDLPQHDREEKSFFLFLFILKKSEYTCVVQASAPPVFSSSSSFWDGAWGRGKGLVLHWRR